MAAHAEYDRARRRWRVRVYARGRQWKRYPEGGEEAARELAADINAELAAEQAALEAAGFHFRRGEPILGEPALRRWAASYKFKRSTSATVQAALENHLIPYFGAMDLRRLTRLDVRHFADRCFELERKGPDGAVSRGLAEATVRNAVSILRRVLNTLALDPEVEDFDASPVPRPMLEVAESARAHPGRKPTRSREAWSPEEAWALVDLARVRERAYWPAFMCLFQTGARLGEVIGLRWDAVSLFDRSIHIRWAVSAGEEGPPKWGKTRHVPIGDELLPILEELAAKRHRREGLVDPDWVFRSPEGQRMQKRNVARAFERLRVRAHRELGVRPLSIHSFRHTWVTSQLRAGEDPQWVADCVGDSLDVIYRHYSHVIPQRRRELAGLRRPVARLPELAADPVKPRPRRRS